MTAVRLVAICHDTTGHPLLGRAAVAAAGRRRARRRAAGAGPPTAAVGPSAATAASSHGEGATRPSRRVTGGGGPPPSPPVTRPGRGPRPLPDPPRRWLPLPSAAVEPSAPAPGGEGSFIPRRPRPPRDRGGSPRETSYRTDAAAPAPRSVPAWLRARRPPWAPAVTLVPFPARVQLALVFGGTAPYPVHLVRGQRVLKALAAHPAGRADRLRPGYLPGPRPVGGHREEQLRIRLQAGGRPPPVAPFLL